MIMVPTARDMAAVDVAPIMSIADGAPMPTLADLAHEVPVVPADMTCEGLDRLFGRRAELDCVLVRHPTAVDVVGMIPRTRFDMLMSGPFGYGRPLYGRRPVSHVAEWDILLLRSTAGVEEAASRAITRAEDRVQDHLVVQDAHGLRALGMPALLAALARALADRALRDSLTGLANRDLFFGRVEEACRRSATQPGHVTAVVYVDLDGFKAANDQLGHDGGDKVLQQVADALVAAARPRDLVARLGGDEFAVAMEMDAAETDVAALAASIAGRLQAAVASVARSAGSGTAIRASVGVAISGSGHTAADELIRAADLAMYTAKRAGGTQDITPVVVSSTAHADPLLGTTVAQAAAAGELVLHYQPIVALRDGTVVSVEALVRWQHPRLGLLTPGSFLPAVQRAGQLVELDDWVVQAACLEFAAWREQAGRPPLPYLNINVSTDRLLVPGVVQFLLDAVAAAELNPQLLRIEVSEDLLFEQIDAVAPILRQLDEVGFSVTFDDVGAGSTSLRHLREVRADGLKIDRSYVHGMVTEERDRAVVRLLVDFAIGTGSRVTGEGIETEEQRELLLAMGCQYGQGWLFARPAPLSELDLGTGTAPQVATRIGAA